MRGHVAQSLLQPRGEDGVALHTGNCTIKEPMHQLITVAIALFRLLSFIPGAANVDVAHAANFRP